MLTQRPRPISNGMNAKILVSAIVVLVVAVGAWFLLKNYQAPVSDAPSDASQDMGSYAYSCDNGSEFTMAPANDVSSVTISAGSQGMFTGTVTLTGDNTGTHFEGTLGTQKITFDGAGEEVRLMVGSNATICSPVANADAAPWNWGDAGEGAGSVKQDASLIVSESIVGKWQSADDAKYVREFQTGGKVQDWYDGKVVSSGTFTAFTSVNPIKVSFPLQAGTVYLQLKMSGSQADTLNFKLNTLSPEALELTYMDRGGVLKFTAVK